MKTGNSRFINMALMGASALCLYVLSVGLPASAGDSPAPAARHFSKQNSAAVNAALAEFAMEQYDRAIPVLENTLALPDLTPYERATIDQMLGQAQYELHNYKASIAAFEAALASGGLLTKEASNLNLNIAQLLIASGQPSRGATRLEAWVKAGGSPKPNHLEILWQAWVQAGQYDRALPWAEDWFKQADPKLRKNYDVLNFLYLQLQMPDQRRHILGQMAKKWPQDKGIQTALSKMKGL